MDGPVVIVTGTSSGIGRDAAKRLKAKGCRVVAVARRLADIQEPGVEAAVADLADPRSLEKLVRQTITRHGRIDALVNNAGFGATLPVEETPPETMAGIFEVNLFGLHRLVRLVLPTMRQQAAGRIVNVSSVAGRISIPMLGAYCASKFALRAYTEALHMEVRQFGIHACLIEPGRIRTSFSRRSHVERDAAQPRPEESPYAGAYRRWGLLRGAGGAHPRVIGDRIVHACTAHRPRFRYLAPWDARLAAAARWALPDGAYHALLARIMK